MARRRKQQPHPFGLSIALAARGQAIELAPEGELEESTRTWVHVATEGQYLGYRDGTAPFMFTRQTFEQVVANIQRHPAYEAGDDGVGATDVVPWDFHHASEMDPTSIAVFGTPARAWTADFEVRDGKDGKSQLWALTRFLEPARGYVKSGSYKWASVALTFDATDPITAKRVGATVTSIALTNRPFIEGMEELVAAARNVQETGERVQLRYRYYEQADSAEAAFSDLKDLFGMPELSDAAALVLEVGKLRQWVEAGTAPLGVEVDEVIGCMRKILGLPTLTPALQVLDSTTQIVQRLIEESAGVESPAEPPPAEPAEATLEKKPMTETLKIMASKLGVVENEDAVRGAVESLVALRAGLGRLLKLDATVSNTLLLESAEKQIGAHEKLGSLLKALGVEDVDGGVDKITTLITQADELEKAMPELKELRTKQEEREAEEQEADVAEAMASHNVPEAAKDALLLMRKNDKDGFRKRFPKPDKPAGVTASHAQVLTQPIAAAGGHDFVVQPNGTLAARAPGQQPAQVVNLALEPGHIAGNQTDAAMRYLSRTMQGWDKLSHEDRSKAAFQLKRQPGVVYQPPAN